MRTFVHGEGADRRFVRIQIEGRRMVVTQAKADGTSKRSEKELSSEAEAESAGIKLAGELTARGYVERKAAATAKTMATKAPAAPRPAAKAVAEPVDANYALAQALEEAPEPAAATLPRMSFAPAATGGTAKERAASARPDQKKKKKKGKKKKGDAGGEKDDKLVIAGVIAVGVALVGLVGYFVWAEFLSPFSIVGTWHGSKLTYEIGHPIIHKFYHLVLDDKHRAAMTFDEKLTFIGTYSVKGNKLKLHLGNDDLDLDREYRFKLGRIELTLWEPNQKEPMVELIRMRDMEKVPPSKKRTGPAVGGDDDDGDDDAPPRAPGVAAPPGAGGVMPPGGGGPPPGMPEDEDPDTDPE